MSLALLPVSDTDTQLNFTSITTELTRLRESGYSPTQPLLPLSGELWFDSSSADLKFYDGTTFQTLGTTAGTGITSISGGTGITLTPDPIVSTGTVALTVPVTLALGGTSATTAPEARANIGFNFYNQGNITGATTFDRANGHVTTATLTGSITVTIAPGGTIGDMMVLILQQDGTGSRVATWPTNFLYAGSVLLLSTAANAVDTITIAWNGTYWFESSRAMNAGNTVPPTGSVLGAGDQISKNP